MSLGMGFHCIRALAVWDPDRALAVVFAAFASRRRLTPVLGLYTGPRPDPWGGGLRAAAVSRTLPSLERAFPAHVR
eukprot:5285818-Pyramimonas_sp.AAC.1